MNATQINAFLDFEDWKKTFAGNLYSKPWQIVFDRLAGPNEDGLIYCALLPLEEIDSRLDDHCWDLRVTDGSPGTSESGPPDARVVKYDRLGFLGGVEPLVLVRSFHHGAPSFLELSEEFRLFHNLYQGKKREEFLKADDAGNLEVVARLTADRVEIRTKELRQFLALKEMSLAILVDINRFASQSLADLKREEDSHAEKLTDACYNWGVRSCSWRGDRENIHAYFMGKKLLAPVPKEQSGKWPFNQSAPENYPEFIIGRDENGKEVTATCDVGKLADYFGNNPGAPHYLTPVHFRSEVLVRYYSNPERFSVEDGYLHAASLWGLAMDNDHPDRVMVFLGDLGRDLPASERDYWKTFNIAIDSSPISKTAFTRSFGGCFSSPTKSDLAFKNLFPHFGQKWRETYGWDLFLPLGKEDEHHFTTVRIPVHNDQSEFDAQIGSLTKILIDSLNEAKLTEGITVPPEAKGITKFQLFLEKQKFPEAAAIIEFCRTLQLVRSTAVAHRKGANYEKVAKSLDMENRELKEIAADLFSKSTLALRSLGKYFLSEENWDRD